MNKYFICRVAVAPIRSSASDTSEIVSQLLFGDRAELKEQHERWFKIRTLYDNYEGWIDPKQLQEITLNDYEQHDAYQNLTQAQYENIITDEQNCKYYLSPGSTLPFYENGFCIIGKNKFKILQKPFIPIQDNFELNIEYTTKFFLNTPYLWGGRHLFGIDCSGFSQIVYKLLGFKLPRDASQQVKSGVVVDFLESSKLGDLAFFDNSDGKITHVGIMLNNHTIIHAAGKVRIDSIDNQGIYNQELEKYTHKLRVIKRIYISNT